MKSAKDSDRERRWRLANPERVRAYNRMYRTANAAKLKEYDRTKRDGVALYERNGRKHHLRRKYGITVAEYQQLLKQQDGQCAICKTDDPGKGKRHFHVDHCHDTGAVRGLLCVKCNMGLGCFNDGRDLLQTAIEYLDRERILLEKSKNVLADL